MINIEQIKVGESYGCKYRITTMLDNSGKPVPVTPTDIAGPGVYEGFGILVKRDLENRKVELHDQDLDRNFVVPFDDIWDIDEIEWT